MAISLCSWWLTLLCPWSRNRCAHFCRGSVRRGCASATSSPARSTRDDTIDDLKYLAAKIRDIRVFESDAGKPMDRSVADVGGSLLVVSQFTLYGDVRKGRRPSFDGAAPPDDARRLYEEFVRELRATRLPVATGEFQAMMHVELVNDGPVTILLDSDR